jgi:hypothetical protein
MEEVNLFYLVVKVSSRSGGFQRLCLREHRERLRRLFRQDQEALLPGVELPGALERKWPKAAGKWNRHPGLTGIAGSCGQFHHTDFSAHGKANGRRYTESLGYSVNHPSIRQPILCHRMGTDKSSNGFGVH